MTKTKMENELQLKNTRITELMALLKQYKEDLQDYEAKNHKLELQCEAYKARLEELANIEVISVGGSHSESC